MKTHKISQPIIYFEQAIPVDLVNLMIEEINLIQPEHYLDSTIGSISDSKIESSIRNSKTYWWYEHHWASSIFSHYFNKANRDIWEYDLNYIDGIQVTKYYKNDHYTWHCDYGTESDERYTRKLSATLVVSDPEDYEGGELEFIGYSGNLISVPNTKGSMIVFDARIPHRVTPVTKGTRVSLVSWMLGPKLR